MIPLSPAAWGFFPPKSKFGFDQIPNLEGKVVIVTGANTGIGKVTALELLKHNARVYAACRTEEKAKAAIEEIKKESGKESIYFLQLDLADIKQCSEAAKQFCTLEDRLDILVNSAGVMIPPRGSKTKDGLELQFGTNVVGHYVFTEGLLEMLKKTSSQQGEARMVWVSSSAHFAFTPNQGIDYKSIKEDVLSKFSAVLYGQSKLGNIHLSNYYARILKPNGILSFSLHPGNIASDLTRHAGSLAIAMSKTILATPEQGALTQLYCATSTDLTIEDSGSYFVPWARKYPTSHPKANDLAAENETVSFCKDIATSFLSS